MLPTLAAKRQIIAVEQQGHGHTAALLRHLDIANADVFGYSDGGNVGLGLAIRHPDRVRKLAIAGTNANNEGLNPGTVDFFTQIGPDDFGPLKGAYEAVAPRPEDWPTLVKKVMAMAVNFPGWAPDDLRALQAPTLVMIADGDVVRPEHAVELFRQIPHAQLAVIPCSDHVTMITERTDWLLPMLAAFFNAPMPDGNKSSEPWSVGKEEQ
jgi:pimeloyl-ACP methyl ester carboxylesterase